MLEWMCGDTSCVNTTTLCDGVNNCPDGTDESFCSFICFNGEEISLEKNCDGVPDCPDGEDENNCLPFTEDIAGATKFIPYSIIEFPPIRIHV